MEVWKCIGPAAEFWSEGLLLAWDKAHLLLELKGNSIKITTVGEANSTLLMKADAVMMDFFDKVKRKS